MDKLNEIDNGENARLLLEEHVFFPNASMQSSIWVMNAQSRF